MDGPHISRWRLFFTIRFRRWVELWISLDFARPWLSPSITLYRPVIEGNADTCEGRARPERLRERGVGLR
jgi:hypothetical protein